MATPSNLRFNISGSRVVATPKQPQVRRAGPRSPNFSGSGIARGTLNLRFDRVMTTAARDFQFSLYLPRYVATWQSQPGAGDHTAVDVSVY